MKDARHKHNRNLAKAILELAEQVPVASITVAMLAKRTGTPLKTVQSLAGTPADFLALVTALIDEEAHSLAGRQETATPLEDRAFDVLMARFEALNSYRPSILALSRQIRKSPDLAYAMYKAQSVSMDKMASWIFAAQHKKHTLLMGQMLLALYHLTFLTWESDMTPDLGPTMSRLNSLIKKCRFAA